MEAGMDDFLTKPVDPVALYQALRSQFMKRDAVTA
jgi:CheY-like chemotaxis protein